MHGKVCAFTGHRPEKLPWGRNEHTPHCEALKTKLLQTVRDLADEGFDTFLCGMARGCDMYFFDAVCQLRRERQNIRIVACLPCPSQARAWPPEDRTRHQAALEAADEVRLLSEFYYDGCMLMRNRHMVDRCNLLLSVWDGSPGGTGSTVSYAKQRKVRILAVWR